MPGAAAWLGSHAAVRPWAITRMYLCAVPSRGTASACARLAAALALLCCALTAAAGSSLDLAVAATGAAAATATTLMPQLLLKLLTSSWAVVARGVLAPATGKPGAGALRARAPGGGLAPLLAPLLLLLCSAATPATAQDTYYVEWMHLGCFVDTGNPRALPYFLGDVNENWVACRDLSINAGMDTFGLQFGGECWACNGCNWAVYGATSGCPWNGGGGACPRLLLRPARACLPARAIPSASPR